MGKLQGFFKGKKSYLVALATIAYAIAGYYTNHLTATQAINDAIGGSALITLRAGLGNALVAALTVMSTSKTTTETVNMSTTDPGAGALG